VFQALNFMAAAARRTRLAWVPAALLAAVLAGGAVARAATPARVPDVLDLPVRAAAYDTSSSTSSVASQGKRLVAVGPRGLIVLSTDGGSHWTEVGSPVQADLVAVKFTGANTLWAVGHDAVALRSNDGGASWQRMLDGRSLLKLLRAQYPSHSGVQELDKLRVEIDRWAAQSATPDVLPTALFDVSFSDAKHGLLVGAFGLILYTEDGGNSWTSWIERADNERRLHLYAVGGQGDQVYIAGEQGLLIKLDQAGKRFVRIKTPYEGSFFGVEARPGRLMVYGLRGNVYVSADQGEQWSKIATGVDASIVAAVSAGGDAWLLVSQTGQVFKLLADGRALSPLPSPPGGEVLGATAAGPGTLLLAGVNGLRMMAIAPSSR
jgi:photosystem II stability/assembly factor-like uncharacterized protein